MNDTKRLAIYTDGAARGNPGPSGIGVLVLDGRGEEINSIARFIGHGTNNQAEYAALLSGLEIAAQYHPDHLDIFLDSELVVNQLNGKYRISSPQLKPLHERSLKLLRQFPSFTITHIPREANRKADVLANKGIDNRVRR